ncbi:MAG: response regulator [Planctomycetes bacterium]|nr:response regulator [Planctomycetota bacterium]
MQRIAIVDPSDVTREPLRNLLLGVESVWIEAECTRYEFFLDVVQQSEPDVVVISLDADQAKALQLIGQVSASHPTMPVLAISGRGDGQSILQALRAGAKEFLTQPVVLEDLLKALNRLCESSTGGSSIAKANSLVLAVIGSRGGVGCTSLAVNLGCNLAQEKENTVALMDLDLAMGDADVALDLVPDHTLADVAQNIERLDMQFLRRTLCKHATGLALLPHPVRIEELGLIHEEHVQRAIGLLRASYTHLILDLSKSFTVTDLTAMQMANEILLVTHLELSSLRNAVRILMSLGAEEGLGDKVKVVLNRVGSDYLESDISQKKAEEILGKPIYWQIPNDSKAMIGARTAGVPLLQHAPRSRVHQSLIGLGNALCGKNGHQEVATTRSGLFSWGKK